MATTGSENRWNALLRVSRSWRLEWNVAQLLARVAREAVEFLDFERGAVFLLEKKGVCQRASWPETSAKEPQTWSSHCLQAAQQVVQTGRSLTAYGFGAQDAKGAGAPQPAQQVLCVPLTANRGILGALYIDAARRAGVTQSDQEFLEMLGLQAAAALEHALLYQSAITDPLTGLYSHIHFQREVEQSVRRAARAEQPLSLILLDLDHFKQLNDTCGHEAGNECLKQVAAVLRATLRTTDVPARFGGDEFELLLPNTSPAAAVQVAEKIRQKISKLEFGVNGRVGATLGVAAYPENALDGQTLFLRADDAMYDAKAAGRNRTRRSAARETDPSPPAALRGKGTPLSPGLLASPVLNDSPSTNESGMQPAVIDLNRPASEQIDGHVVLRRLGTGSTGEVLLVRQPELDREVALKRPLTPHLTPKQARAFEQEARITASLHHPGVLPVHTMGRDHDGRRYYTMKPLTGCSLAEILEGRRSGDAATLRNFGLNRLLEILQRASETISYAHTRNVRHLDLTGGNILVGKYGEVTVIDWGHAARHSSGRRPVRRKLPLAPNSQLVFLVGSPGYLAPEQLPGSQISAGAHSDVHALGALLYEILTDRPPYRHESTHETLQSLMHGRVVSPEKLVPEAGIDPALSDLAMQSLQTDPSRRPSAQEFCDRISRYIRREQDWAAVCFDPAGHPLDESEWANVLPGACQSQWRLQDGEWVSKGDGSNFLVWKVPVPGPFRFICEGWIEAQGECSLLGRVPLKADGMPHVEAGYCFQFGGDGGICTKLTRNNHDVLARPGLAPVPGQRYRLELEYQEGWLSCFIDGKRIFCYRELFPFSGKHVGFYAWGPGTHIRPLEVQQQNWGLHIPAISVADDLYAEGQYAMALQRYREIAVRVAHRMEGTEAALKSGLCLVRLQRENEAREVFHSLAGSPFEPFALAEEAVLDFTPGPHANSQHGLQCFQRLFSKFPESQARVRILELMPVFNKLEHPTQTERARFMAESMRLGRATSEQPSQTQFRCQAKRTEALLELGEYNKAFEDMEDFKRISSRGQQDMFACEGQFFAVAMAKGLWRERSERVLELNVQGMAAPMVWSCAAILTRQADEIVRLFDEKPPEDILGQFAALLLYLNAGRQDRAWQYLRTLRTTAIRNMAFCMNIGPMLAASNAGEMLEYWLAEGVPALESRHAGWVWKHVSGLRAQMALSAGDWDAAARILQAEPPLTPPLFRSPVFWPMMLLHAAGRLKEPAPALLLQFCAAHLAGTELDLARMLLGEKEALIGDGWPAPLWHPEWRLYAALWHEAHGRRAEAREAALPALDSRFGQFHYQPALRALIKRTS